MVEERLLPIRLTVKDLKSLRGLELDTECMPRRERSDGMIELDAIATESTVTKLQAMRSKDVLVEVLNDRIDDESSVTRLVSQSNRYAAGDLPRGTGKRDR